MYQIGSLMHTNGAEMVFKDKNVNNMQNHKQVKGFFMELSLSLINLPGINMKTDMRFLKKPDLNLGMSLDRRSQACKLLNSL